MEQGDFLAFVTTGLASSHLAPRNPCLLLQKSRNYMSRRPNYIPTSFLAYPFLDGMRSKRHHSTSFPFFFFSFQFDSHHMCRFFFHSFPLFKLEIDWDRQPYDDGHCLHDAQRHKGKGVSGRLLLARIESTQEICTGGKSADTKVLIYGCIHYVDWNSGLWTFGGQPQIDMQLIPFIQPKSMMTAASYTTVTETQRAGYLGLEGALMQGTLLKSVREFFCPAAPSMCD